jgi:PAS domain S-box-containing protein
MMEQVDTLNVAIVGGGPGAKAIMDMIFAEKLSQLRMKLIGIACTNPKAVGYRYAREKGIYTTGKYRNLYEFKDLNMIVELTGRDEVANEICRNKPDHIRLMDHVGARLFWDVFQIEEARITERQQGEKQLRESEDKCRKVLEACPDAVVVYDMEGNAIYINPAFTRIFGWTTEELLGMKIDYVPEENWPETQMMIDKVLLGKSFSGVESRRYTKRGDVLDVSISVATYLDRGGMPVGSVHCLRDITQRKRVEEALRKAHDDLEQRVEERTAKLAKTTEQLKMELIERKRVEKERKRLVSRLQKALANVKKMSGLLPICSSCKKIRDDNGYWNQIEAYIRDRSEAEFSHSICPECRKKLYPELDQRSRPEIHTHNCSFDEWIAKTTMGQNGGIRLERTRGEERRRGIERTSGVERRIAAA